MMLGTLAMPLPLVRSACISLAGVSASQMLRPLRFALCTRPVQGLKSTNEATAQKHDQF